MKPCDYYHLILTNRHRDRHHQSTTSAANFQRREANSHTHSHKTPGELANQHQWSIWGENSLCMRNIWNVYFFLSYALDAKQTPLAGKWRALFILQSEIWDEKLKDLKIDRQLLLSLISLNWRSNWLENASWACWAFKKPNKRILRKWSENVSYADTFLTCI